MKSWKQIIEHAYKQKVERNWTKLYWCIDLHDTVISGKYNRYNIGSELYPHAKKTLDYLYNSDLHRTILWTSSYTDSVTQVLKTFDLNFHYQDENPECPETELCNFKKKFYFNFLLDDKGGFCGNSDWKEIYDSLRNLD